MSNERHQGIHVLRLAGTDYEMGFQHGRALRDAIPRGPLPYFARYVERLLHGIVGGFSRPVARATSRALYETIGRRIQRQFPSDARAALDGLADGAGISRAELMRAVTMPETYLWVASRFVALRRVPVAPRLSVPSFPSLGCTSAIAWGRATRDGRLLHGRNFDYHGVGTWDREQAVVFHRPTNGQRYVSIAAAGVLFGGITAMNESGLSLVVHQHMYASEVDLGGLPVGIVGDRVMRHARNLADARRILDEHVPNGSWTYVVSSAREQAVLCYEVTSKRRAVAPTDRDDDTFGYTNMFLAEPLAGLELHGYPAHWRHVAGRYHRAREILGERRGTLDETGIAAVLADTGDPRCRLSDSIAMMLTVASVVFDGERGLVWVATGRAPVSNNPYVAFDLQQERARPDLGELHPSSSLDPTAREAYEAYRDAFEADFDDGDVVRARAHVERARRLQPEQPLYHHVAGLLAMRSADPTTAERCFDEALAVGHPTEQRVASFHLWRGRARDRLGRRADACADYRLALPGDRAAARAAERGLRTAYRGGNVAIEWTFGDVLSV